MEESPQHLALVEMEKLVIDMIDMVHSDNTFSNIELVGMMWAAFDLGKQRERRNYMMED